MKQTIKNFVYFLLIASIIAVCVSSCATQKNGCYATKGMSGYK